MREIKTEGRLTARHEGDDSTDDSNDAYGGQVPCDEPPVPEPELYTPVEMAAMLRVPLRTLEKWVLQRRIPVIKVGRLNRFPRVEIKKRILSGSLLR